MIAFYGIGGNIISTVFLATANRWTKGQNADAINALYSWLHEIVTLALALSFTFVSIHTISVVFGILSLACCLGSLLLCLLK